MAFYWFCLAMAIMIEIFAAMCLKKLAFDESVKNRFILLLGLLFFIYPLIQVFHFNALKKIEISIAYLIWSGIGCTLSVILGYLLFSESISVTKLGGMALILIGVVMLTYK